MPQHGPTKSLPFVDELISNTNIIGLGIIDDVNLAQVQGLVEVVSTSWPLVVIGRGDTEVAHLASRTQRRQ